MGLPWARLDANICTNDKICWLKTQRGGWKAISCYLFSLAWSVGHGTDGHIPTHMTGTLDVDKPTIALLVAAQLWVPRETGWDIKNYAERQQLSMDTTELRASKQVASTKGNCVRWHGPECGCWRS